MRHYPHCHVWFNRNTFAGMLGEQPGVRGALTGRVGIAVMLGIAVLLSGVIAQPAGAKTLSKSQKAKVRAQLRKQVKRNPRVLRRRSFLRKAALVNFKLPVTIRLRNPCSEEAGQNPRPTIGGVAARRAALGQNCLTQGTALNQRTLPDGVGEPRSVARDPAGGAGGGLAAVVEFQDTYDGGALGNVNIKILPGNKTLSSSSVPLLWNQDISGPGARSDANAARSLSAPGGMLASLQRVGRPPAARGVATGCRRGNTGGLAAGPATTRSCYGAPDGPRLRRRRGRARLPGLHEPAGRRAASSCRSPRASTPRR